MAYVIEGVDGRSLQLRNALGEALVDALIAALRREPGSEALIDRLAAVQGMAHGAFADILRDPATSARWVRAANDAAATLDATDPNLAALARDAAALAG